MAVRAVYVVVCADVVAFTRTRLVIEQLVNAVRHLVLVLVHALLVVLLLAHGLDGLPQAVDA